MFQKLPVESVVAIFKMARQPNFPLMAPPTIPENTRQIDNLSSCFR